MNVLIAALFYTASSFVLCGIFLSYFLALRMKWSIPVLSLCLFFLINSVVIISNALAFWNQIFAGDFAPFPYSGFRAILLFFSCLFVFYTTWREN